MSIFEFHKKRDWELSHSGKHDVSLCEKIHDLAEAVDFQHAKHNFFSAFLHVQDQVKYQFDRVIKHKEPFIPRSVRKVKESFKELNKKLFPRKKSHVREVLSHTKGKVFEVMHMDEIIESTIKKVAKQKVMKEKAEGVMVGASKGMNTNIVQPLKEVCNVSALTSFLEKLHRGIEHKWYKMKAGMHMASKPMFASARVFGVFAIIFTGTFVILNIEAITTVSNDYIKTDSMFSDYFIAKEVEKEYIETQSLAPAPDDLVLAEEEREENTEGINLIPLNLEVTPDDNRIEIPRIGKNVPVRDVADETVIYSDRLADIEDSLQEALQEGIVRYPGTAIPGEQGNVFLTGHSSYYLFAPGKYKDVLALLHKVEMDDEIFVYYNQKKVKYKVTEIREVWPTDVDILKQTDDYRLTLMTCTPIGTNLKRLVVTAIQVD